MYIKPLPIGNNPPLDEDRMPIWRAVSGDDLWFETRITLRSGEPVTQVNSRLKFAISESRFSYVPIWEGSWNDGIEPVNQEEHPGLVKVSLPSSISNRLRRGAYSFSMSVADRFGKDSYTPIIGALLVEYEPTSPEHDIPYKDQIGEN